MATSEISRNQAVKLLRFYLKSTRLAAGLTWDGDNDGEIEMLIDYIIDAATQRMDEEKNDQEAES